MTINNPQKFVDTLWDWSMWNGCFEGTNISMSDIDGFVERNGEMLIVETKSPNANIPLGQSISYERLSRKKNATILVLWGEPNKPERGKLYCNKGKVINYPHLDLNKARKIVSDWFKWASRKSANRHIGS